MCYGKVWSMTSLSSLMIVAIICSYYKTPLTITLPLFFLASKELIQCLLYYNLESCNSNNKWLTAAAWLHVSFQPFFVNLFISAFSKNPTEYKIPLILCLIFGVFNILRLKEFSMNNLLNDSSCIPNIKNNVCRNTTCSINGERHLAYGFNLSSTDIGYFTPSLFSYVLLSFGPAFIIGDWQLAGIHLSVAVLSSLFARKDAGEAAAVWCVNSFWVVFFAIYYIVKNKK